jgi:hypothetical protein
MSRAVPVYGPVVSLPCDKRLAGGSCMRHWAYEFQPRHLRRENRGGSGGDLA